MKLLSYGIVYLLAGLPVVSCAKGKGSAPRHSGKSSKSKKSSKSFSQAEQTFDAAETNEPTDTIEPTETNQPTETYQPTESIEPSEETFTQDSIVNEDIAIDNVPAPSILQNIAPDDIQSTMPSDMPSILPSIVPTSLIELQEDQIFEGYQVCATVEVDGDKDINNAEVKYLYNVYLSQGAAMSEVTSTIDYLLSRFLLDAVCLQNGMASPIVYAVAAVSTPIEHAVCGPQCFIMNGVVNLKTDLYTYNQYETIRCSIARAIDNFFGSVDLESIHGGDALELLFSGTTGESCAIGRVTDAIIDQPRDSVILSSGTTGIIIAGSVGFAVLVAFVHLRRRSTTRDASSVIDSPRSVSVS